MSAKKTQKTEAILEPASTAELIKGLIRALNHDPAKVKGLDISATYVRVLGKDRSMRTHAIGEEWDVAPIEEEGANG